MHWAKDFVVAALVGIAATHLYAATPAGTPPRFYCDINRPAGADRVETQLNTLAVSATDRGNQPRWEYAVPSSPNIFFAPDPLPTPTNGWTFFTGLEITGYAGGLSAPESLLRVGFYPAQAGAVNFTMRYFRYRFELDSSVNPKTYAIDLSNYFADDQVAATYLNGKRVATTAAARVGAGPTPDLQWRAGLNELAFAVFDSNAAATSLRVGNAVQSSCDTYPAAPIPTLNYVGLTLMAGMLFVLGRRHVRSRT